MNSGSVQGVIYKALSGFYYVKDESGEITQCRARGKMRKGGQPPLVGDRVQFSRTDPGEGIVERLLERKNAFIRPPLANLDTLIIVASEVNPVSDTFLIDKITAVAAETGCDCIICINKCDLNKCSRLYDIYKMTGYLTLYTSCLTGEGIGELRDAISGKVCGFVGNSGAGKSSLLNALVPGLKIETAQVSRKLGRGRHTTRHVELYELDNGAIIADTPGFSSFDTAKMKVVKSSEVGGLFVEFRPYLGECKFSDCAHLSDDGCKVIEAVEDGKINASRHSSYKKLYESAKQIKEWETNKKQ